LGEVEELLVGLFAYYTTIVDVWWGRSGIDDRQWWKRMFRVLLAWWKRR
jgi:hypothetical protein